MADLTKFLRGMGEGDRKAFRDEMSKDGKAEARYVEPAPSPDVRCENCTMFRAPSSCTAVAGLISPRGHCRYFEAIDG